MAKYPVRIDLTKIKPKLDPKGEFKPAPRTTQKDLNRHARMQAEEERSERPLIRKKPQIITNTVRMRETPAKKGR